MAAGRAASVVGALALSEVPTILEIAPGAPTILADPLIAVASRVVLDSSRVPLERVAEIAQRTRAPIGDRAFVRAFSWRELIARFFDDRVEAARSIRRVEIERALSDRHDPAALLVGWLASRLGWKLVGKDAAVDPRGDRVAIVTRAYEGGDLAPGELSAVRIGTSLGGAPLDLACTREGGRRAVRWHMSGARTAEHEHPLGYRDEGWVLLKTIESTEGDQVYREAALAAADWSSR
jgi:glucose-6-phosphate dehydrogenase assembly protein OpcA